MDIIPGKPFYSCIVNMATKPGELQKFIVVAYESRAPTCIINARYDEPHTVTDERPITTQCDRFDSGPTINAVRYKPPKRLEEQSDRENAVNQS